MFSDNNDRQTQLLEAIYQELADQQPQNVTVEEGDTTIDESVRIDDGEGVDPAGMFTTGPNGVLLEAAGMDDYRKFDFGFDANVVNIRSPAALYVAFTDPSNNPGFWIPIGADEIPFTIGGSVPIGADTVWITQQDPNATESEVHLIAY